MVPDLNTSPMKQVDPFEFLIVYMRYSSKTPMQAAGV